MFRDQGFYTAHEKMLVGVDCMVFTLREGRLCLLLTRRKFEPALGSWSLMGGFVKSDESVDNAAYRVLHQLTGLDNVYMEQVGAFGDLDRDPGERVVSVAYYAPIKWDDVYIDRVKAYNAQWVDVDNLPELCFDHPLMIRRAIKAMRRKATCEPIAFELLPEYFTLTQLQNLYETILGEPADKRNFRRRILENPCIKRTDLIDKVTSRRGASLYTFDEELYAQSVKFKM